MKLTEKEKKICKQYRKRDKNGKVHCSECPLGIHHFNYDYGRCKYTLTKKEWKKAQNEV